MSNDFFTKNICFRGYFSRTAEARGGRSLFSGDDHEPAVLRLVGAGDQSKKQVAALGGDAGVVERMFPIIGHGLVEAALVRGVIKLIEFEIGVALFVDLVVKGI